MNSMNIQETQVVLQNLKDAGCDPDTISAFLGCMESGEVDRQLRLLSDHRQTLLSRVHREEKRIDCLDYLVYQIRKNKIKT